MMQSVDLYCDQCRAVVARISLLNAGEGEGMWKKDDRLERAGFIGNIILFGHSTETVSLFEALSRLDHAAADRINPDFVSFYCRPCNKIYCKDCWTIGPPVFDEGFYDYTLGVCPQGHEQTVDD
jgi:hypothetical protein